METRIAIWTEWAWAQGLLETAAERRRWAAKLFAWNAARFPRSRTCATVAVPLFEAAVTRVLRALEYGGRRPADLPPARREALARQTAAGFAVNC